MTAIEKRLWPSHEGMQTSEGSRLRSESSRPSCVEGGKSRRRKAPPLRQPSERRDNASIAREKPFAAL